MSGGGSEKLKGTVSVDRAVTIGLLWVNGPVFLLMVGPIVGFLAVDRAGLVPPQLQWRGICLFGAGWLLAWLWWSFTVPKWRLWAYARVLDIVELKRSAVKAGLTWPDGSIFERTEIKSRAHRQLERKFERHAGRPDLDP
jgi:hypothetical protein